MVTAPGIAIVGAEESEKPVGERVCFDPFARQFVPAWMRTPPGFAEAVKIARQADAVILVLGDRSGLMLSAKDLQGGGLCGL
jgi:hypothetical protein